MLGVAVIGCGSDSESETVSIPMPDDQVREAHEAARNGDLAGIEFYEDGRVNPIPSGSRAEIRMRLEFVRHRLEPLPPEDQVAIARELEQVEQRLEQLETDK